MKSEMRNHALAAVVLGLSMLSAGIALGAKGPSAESREAAESAQQMAEARAAPGIVLPGAYSAAWATLIALPIAPASWHEVTTRPYNADDPRYRDPNFSNSSGGAGFVAGRNTGLAVGGG